MFCRQKFKFNNRWQRRWHLEIFSCKKQQTRFLISNLIRFMVTYETAGFLVTFSIRKVLDMNNETTKKNYLSKLHGVELSWWMLRFNWDFALLRFSCIIISWFSFFQLETEELDTTDLKIVISYLCLKLNLWEEISVEK